MVRYIPIDSGFALACSTSDLLELRWRHEGIVADFIDPTNDERLWRVQFDEVIAIRVIDEFYISTEEETPKEGLVAENFAYLVENRQFFRSQPELLRRDMDFRHYQFVTAWACLDVISHKLRRFGLPLRAAGNCR
ncbi:hypothetical protein [Mesorhizobium sp. KR9-304]|uniref:hypothetical protein n=1 Tax=Mesorhizobium sp. KR9-304 TaxID=3156614 RepID=UPI0032B3675F